MVRALNFQCGCINQASIHLFLTNSLAVAARYVSTLTVLRLYTTWEEGRVSRGSLPLLESQICRARVETKMREAGVSFFVLFS